MLQLLSNGKFSQAQLEYIDSVLSSLAECPQLWAAKTNTAEQDNDNVRLLKPHALPACRLLVLIAVSKPSSLRPYTGLLPLLAGHTAFCSVEQK